MKNSKKLFLIVLSVLIVAFVSCNKVTESTIPTAQPTFKVSDIEGTWSGTNVRFTIDNNGNFSMTSPFTLTYQIPEADWNSEQTEYIINGDDVGLTGASITFKSATSGTATMGGNTVSISKQ